MNSMKTKRILEEIVEMYKVKKKLRYFVYIIMLGASVENFKNAEVYTIIIGNRKSVLVRMKDVKKKLGIKSISDLERKEIHDIYDTKNPTKEQIRKYKRSEKELDKNSNCSFKYVRSDLMSIIIKISRGEKKGGKGIDGFRLRLGFKEHDIIITKEDSIISKIMKIFAKENIKLHHSVLNYYIDFCISVSIDW